MPAHITILYPFVPPAQSDENLLADLRHLFAGRYRFDFSLVRTARFPSVLYLQREPTEPFIALAEAVAARYPDYPPYEGAFPDIVAHLTVANIDNEEELAQVEAAFVLSCDRRLPLSASADRVWLMAKRGGMWRKHTAFPLGAC